MGGGQGVWGLCGCSRDLAGNDFVLCAESALCLGYIPPPPPPPARV